MCWQFFFSKSAFHRRPIKILVDPSTTERSTPPLPPCVLLLPCEMGDAVVGSPVESQRQLLPGLTIIGLNNRMPIGTFYENILKNTFTS
jgi:hypothetical protein